MKSNALSESQRIQDAASALGFDWPDIEGVFDKVHEELDEIRQALAEGDAEQARREIGDVLFAAVNLARFLGAEASDELTRTNNRFSTRFSMVKRLAAERNWDMRTRSLDELDQLWNEAKKAEKAGLLENQGQN